MIQPNELRIGNIFWENYGGYNVVTSINCNRVGEAPNTVSARHIAGTLSGSFDCSHIEPIPLSPTILEKCGFEVTGLNKSIYSLFLSNLDENKFSRQRIDFISSDTDGKVELCRSGVCFKRIKCSSLHQLQNIYFVLTGNELTINKL